MSRSARRSTPAAELSPESPEPRSSSGRRRASSVSSTGSGSSSTSGSADSSPPEDKRRELRVTNSAGRNSTGRQLSLTTSSVSSGARARRSASAPSLTPRRNSNRLSDFIVDDGMGHNEEEDRDSTGSESNDQLDNSTRRRQVNFRTESNSRENGNNGERSRRATVSASIDNGRTRMAHQQRRARQQQRCHSDGSRLSWYERLMPEFVLNMTAPITGYETARARADEQLNEEELELLERQRFRRNRRVRRRLLAAILVASLASAFFIYRGRSSTGGLMGFRRAPQGVRETIGEMAHRLEDGFSRTVHDTMGK